MNRFEKDVLELRPAILAYACRLVRTVQDAEDITQQVLIRAVSNQHKFQKDCSLKTWCFKITTNLSIDFYRNTRTYDNIRAALEKTTVETYDGGLTQVEQRLALPPLDDILGIEDLVQKIEGAPVKEIAASNNRTVAATKSRIHRARLIARQRILEHQTV